MQKTVFAFKDSYFFRTGRSRRAIFFNILSNNGGSAARTIRHGRDLGYGEQKNKREPAFDPLLFPHSMRLIVHVVVIVAHGARVVRNLVGTLYFVIAVIVVVLGRIGCRIVDLDINFH